MRQEIILSLLCGNVCLSGLNVEPRAAKQGSGLHVRHNFLQKNIKLMVEDINDKVF